MNMVAYLIIALAFLADRLTKWWVANNILHSGPVELNSFITLRATYNQGVAFGMLPGLGPMVGWVSIFIILGLLYYMRRLPGQEVVLRMGLALMIGGSLGNLVDRLIAGQVLDFIIIPLRTGIFNVADIMINLGVGVAILGAFFQRDELTEE